MYRNLEAELKRKGITRAQLAEMLGLNISTISQKLNGKSPLLYDEATTIAQKVFDGEFSPEYLFAKVNKPA